MRILYETRQRLWMIRRMAIIRGAEEQYWESRVSQVERWGSPGACHWGAHHGRVRAEPEPEVRRTRACLTFGHDQGRGRAVVWSHSNVMTIDSTLQPFVHNDDLSSRRKHSPCVNTAPDLKNKYIIE